MRTEESRPVRRKKYQEEAELHDGVFQPTWWEKKKHFSPGHLEEIFKAQ